MKRIWNNSGHLVLRTGCPLLLYELEDEGDIIFQRIPQSHVSEIVVGKGRKMLKQVVNWGKIKLLKNVF